MAFNFGAITGALEETKSSPTGVDFSGRSLKLDSAKDAQPIIEAISSCAILTYLDLTGNTLGVDAAEAIASALAKKPELKKAKWSDMFTGRMKTEIPPALSALGNGMISAGTQLTVLELSDNAFGPIGVEGLAKLLQSPVCSQLQELRLNNNGLGITGGRLLAEALLGSQQAPPRLRVFIAGRNRLENDGALALAQVFRWMGSLEEIAMPQNGIYHVGISALCESFKHNPNLGVINLNDNTIGPKGAAAFAKVLPRLKGLRSLNFGDCLLKSKGALALAQAFRENDVKLEVLDLSYNEIKSAACAELVSSVSRLSDSLDRLERVVLTGNSLGGAVGKKLMREKLGAAAELSDGEGSGDEDEDEEEESEEESEVQSGEGSEEESDASTESGDTEDETTPENDEDKFNETAVEEVKSDVQKFISDPTLDNLNRLGDNPAELIDTHLRCMTDACRWTEAYVEAAMLLAGLSARCQTARAGARELLSRAARQARDKHVALWLLTNTLLVHLALIKSESKSFSIRWDLDGCYSVLSEVIAEPFIPDSLRETVKFFAKSKADKDPKSLVTKYPKLLA